MQETSTSAVGVLEPFGGREPFVMRGEGVTRVGREGDLAILGLPGGAVLKADADVARLIFVALGIALPRPAAPAIDVEPVRLQTRCGWCKALMHEGPLDADGHESTGFCGSPECARKLRG